MSFIGDALGGPYYSYGKSAANQASGKKGSGGGLSFIGDALGAGYNSDWSPDTAGQVANLLNPVGQNVAENGITQQQHFISALDNQAGGMQGQAAAFQAYQNLANGTGANPAQAMLAQATGANVSNQAALAAGQRGASGNVGMVARQAGMQGANAMQGAAGQAATMQAQQQVQGIQGMAGVSEAQTNQIANQINSYNQNNLGSIGSYNQAQAGLYGSQNTSDTAIQLQNDKNKSGMFGGLLSGAGGVLSDERAKTDVKPADDKIQAFLDAVGAHQYRYKAGAQGLPGADAQSHVGPMAQELEKSELGRQMVNNSPQGKSVDFQRGLGTIVAAQASLNERLKQLESGKKAPKKMAQGGEVERDSFGLPQFGKAMQQNMQQTNAPQESEQRLSQGAQDFAKGITDKYIKPYTDPYLDSIKRSVTDFLHPGSALNLNPNLTNPSLGVGNLNGAQTPGGPNLGMQNLDGTMPAPESNISLGTDTNLAAAEAPGQTGLESIGGEAATDAAAGGTEATEGAEAAEAGEAAEGAEATEAAGAFEGGEGAAAILASKGGKIQAKGKVPVLLSPGEAYIPPNKVKEVAKGKSPKEVGKMVPGKAKMKGDSEKNDTVPAKLAPGGVVIPRTVMNSKEHERKAADFVNAILAKSSMKRNK